MYRILTILLLLIALPLSAQKIVDKSQKHRPDWIGTVQEGLLYASATDNDLERARQKAIATIKVEMLSSVAENIESSTVSLMEQITAKGEASSIIYIRHTGSSCVVSLPFLSGISFARAKGSYWEKSINTEGKTEYTFHLLYPFPESEYAELRSQFLKLDGNKVMTVSHYEEALNNINSVDSILIAIGKLQEAKDYFFDKQRKEKAENVLSQYKSKLNNINIVSQRSNHLEFKFWLELDGRKLYCSIMPKIKAACASNIKYSTNGQTYTLTFSDEYCVTDDDNIISLLFNFNGHRLKNELHF